MSSWKNLMGKPNDHVCQYLEKGYHVYNSGIIFTHYERVYGDNDGYLCKACGSKKIPDDRIKDLCFDSQNAKDVFETCEEFKKTRTPFS